MMVAMRSADHVSMPITIRKQRLDAGVGVARHAEDEMAGRTWLGVQVPVEIRGKPGYLLDFES